MPHLLPYSCAKSAVAALAEGLNAELRGDGVSVTAVRPRLMRTGSHLAGEFGCDRAEEFTWFSALAGTPLVSMDARRAAERIVTAADTGDTSGLRGGRDQQRAAEERMPAAVRRLRKWGSALNDRAARAFNQRTHAAGVEPQR